LTNSSNSFSKLKFIEDLGMPDLSLELFSDMAVKHFNHIVERGLVSCKFVDFRFLRHTELPFVEKLENLGYMGLFKVSDEVYLQLVRSFYANFMKVEPRGMVEPTRPPKSKTVTTLTNATIERILNLNLDPSKFPPSVLASQGSKTLP